MEKEEKPLKPLKDYILIEFQPFIDRKRPSGLYVAPPKFEGVPNRGRVYAIAENIDSVKVGDIVIFKSEKAAGFKYKGMKLIPVKISEVQGVIEENTDENIS